MDMKDMDSETGSGYWSGEAEPNWVSP
jgi:hypothetical protein